MKKFIQFVRSLPTIAEDVAAIRRATEMQANSLRQASRSKRRA